MNTDNDLIRQETEAIVRAAIKKTGWNIENNDLISHETEDIAHKVIEEAVRLVIEEYRKNISGAITLNRYLSISEMLEQSTFSVNILIQPRGYGMRVWTTINTELNTVHRDDGETKTGKPRFRF